MVLKFLLKYEKVASMMVATTLHAGIGFYIIKGSMSNTSIAQQSLQVHLVAPSKELNTHSLINIKPNEVVKISETGTKALVKNAKNNRKELQERKTTGMESAEAKQVHSAITEPIFNAAYLNNPPPIYPQAAKNDGIQGIVLLLVEVSPEGMARSTKISESSGYSLLDSSAKNAVSLWKFIPAVYYGKPVSASVLVPIEFKLS